MMLRLLIIFFRCVLVAVPTGQEEWRFEIFSSYEEAVTWCWIPMKVGVWILSNEESLELFSQARRGGR